MKQGISCIYTQHTFNRLNKGNLFIYQIFIAHTSVLGMKQCFDDRYENKLWAIKTFDICVISKTYVWAINRG